MVTLGGAFLARQRLPAPCQLYHKKNFIFFAYRLDLFHIPVILTYMISSINNPVPASIVKSTNSSGFRMNHHFQVLTCRPKYDDRDGLCGTVYHRHHDCKTLGMALYHARKIADSLYEGLEYIDMDDPRIEIRVHPDHVPYVSKSKKKRDMWANAIIMGCDSVIPF